MLWEIIVFIAIVYAWSQIESSMYDLRQIRRKVYGYDKLLDPVKPEVVKPVTPQEYKGPDTTKQVKDSDGTTRTVTEIDGIVVDEGF